MRAMEADRRRAVRLQIVSLIAAAPLAIGVLVAFGPSAFGIFAAGALMLIAGGMGGAPLARIAGKTKLMLMRPAVQALGFRYREADFPAPGFETLARFGLLGAHERATFEDLIEGDADGKSFAVCEAHLTRQVRTRNGTRTVTVFRGLIGRIDHPARVLGETVLARSGFLRGVTMPRGMQRAGLVDAGFERVFTLWTTDQVEARYLVTPDVMQRLLDLEASFHGRRLRAAFSGGGLYFALEGKNLFEAGSVFSPLDDPVRMKRLIEELASVRALILSLRHLRGPGSHS